MRRLPVVLGVLLACAPALADDDSAHAKHAAQRTAAEKAGFDARKTPKDKAKQLACGQAYLDTYNAEPEAPDNDDVLWAAGECFYDGGSYGATIIVLNLLPKYYPRSALSARAILRLGRVYAEIGMFDKATDRLEEYAKKYAGERDAADALFDAATLRRGLGQDLKVIDDAKLYVRMFGKARPSEAAGLALAVGEAFERLHDNKSALEVYESYVRDYGDRAGADRLAIAHARIGELLWDGGCPVRTVDGLCIAVNRERALPVAAKPGKTRPTQCGSAARMHVTSVARTVDAQRGLDALAAATAPGLAAIVASTPGRDQAEKDVRIAAVRRAFAHAKLIAADAQLEAMLVAPFPKGLTFDRRDAAGRARSMKALSDWVDDHKKKSAAASDGYRDAVAVADPEVVVAAHARLGQLNEMFADALAGAEIPMDVRTGEFADDKIQAYCEAMDGIAAPIHKAAADQLKECLAKSSDVATPWTALCRRELAQLEPTAWGPVAEVVPPPALVALPLRLEGPDATSPAAALTEFTRRDGTKWNDVECRRVAKLFEGAASAKPSAAAMYMAGLAYHRCDLVADAERAYRTALSIDGGHVASLSNLAAIVFGTGHVDQAKELWDKANAANGKLISARIGAAAAMYAQLVQLPETDAKWKSLDEDLRFHLSNALALDPEDPLVYARFALVYVEGAARQPGRYELAARFLERGAAKGAASAPFHVARGVVLARRGTYASALDAWKRAAALDPGNTAAGADAVLAQLHVQRPELAIAGMPKATGAYTYEAQLALGVAYARTGKLAEAEAQYAAAIKTDAARVEAQFDFGLLHLTRAREARDPVATRGAFELARDSFKAVADRARVGTDVAAASADLVRDCERAIALLPAKSP